MAPTGRQDGGRQKGDAANRRILSRALIVLGALAFALAVVFALLPGTPAACGSMLGPMFPPTIGSACAAAQVAWAPAAAVCVLLGLAGSVAGAVLSSTRRSRRRPGR